MNNETKRASNVELLLRQRLELLSEAGTPESGQVTIRTSCRRSLVSRLTSRIKTLWADKGSTEPLSPGRNLEDLVLTYASGNEPVQDEATLYREADRSRTVA
jgi:hypothetical protein